MKTIDLNADLGEGSPSEAALLEIVTSANICCGAHAGSPEITRATVETCLARGIRIGAHPGYPDRENFGRCGMQALKMNSLHLYESIQAQINLIPEACYIKPHGGLYNDSATEFGGSRDQHKSKLLKTIGRADPEKNSDTTLIPASFILEVLGLFHRIPLMGLPGTYHEEIAKFSKYPLIREGFIDRRYLASGHLMPRSEPEAVIHDLSEAIDQALRLAETCDSLCVHGDNPESVRLLTQVRHALETNGYTVTAP